MEELKVHPIYKQIAKEISDRKDIDGYGFILQHEELAVMLETEYKTQKYRSLIEALKDYLLKTYRIYLNIIHKTGYKIVHPDSQAILPEEKARIKIKGACRKWIDGSYYVDYPSMSSKSKKQLEESQKRVSMQEKFMKDEMKYLPK